MSDEMIQQQRTPSAAPYVLTGGIVGGGASALTGLWKPGWAYEPAKYASWDDAVVEMTQKDKFDAAVRDGAQMPGATKDIDVNFETAANKYRDLAEAAGADYDAKLEAYKANGGELAELPEDSQALKDLKAAQEKLDAKRAELEKAEADRIKAEGANAPKATVAEGKGLSKQYIEVKEKEIKALKDEVATAEANVRAKEVDLEKIRQQFADRSSLKAREINERMQHIAELEISKKSSIKDKELQAVKDKISELEKTLEQFKAKYNNVKSIPGCDESLLRQYRQAVYDTSKQLDIEKAKLPKTPEEVRKINEVIANERNMLQTEIDNFAKDQAAQIEPPKGMNPKQVAKFREQKAAEIKDYLVRLGQEMDAIVADPMKEVADLATKQAAAKAKLQASGITLGEGTKSVENNIKAQKLKLEKLNNIKAKYAQFLEDAKPEDIEQIKSIFEHYDEKNNYKGKTVEKTPSGKKNIVNDFESLLDKDMKKDFKRLVDETGDVGQAIDSAIAKHTENIKELEAIAKVDRRIVELAGEGAKFENGVLKDAAGKEVKLTTPKVKVDGIEISTSKELENAKAELNGRQKKLNTVVEKFEKAKANGQAPAAEVKALTEEEIAAKAKEAAEKALAETNEQKIFNDAKKAADEARANLPKGEAKDVETLAKEFVEKNGSREEWIKKAMKDSEEAGKKDLAKWFEKGAMKKGKFWGITAAAVVAGAILGKLIAPKKEQV